MPEPYVSGRAPSRSSRADVCYRGQAPGMRSATVTLQRTILRLLQESVSLSSIPDSSGSETI